MDDFLNKLNIDIKNRIDNFKIYINKYSRNINIKFLSELEIKFKNKSIKLKKLSIITIDNMNTFLVTPFNKKDINIINKSINNYNLDLNLICLKDSIKIILNQITEEKKLKIIKLLKEDIEKEKIIIRSIKQKVNTKIKLLKDNKKISKDKYFEYNKHIVDIINNNISEIDNLFKLKEKELIKF